MQAFNPVFQLTYGCMGKEGAEWLSNLIFPLASESMQSVIQMALKVIFLEKSKSHTVTRALPTDLFLYKMIELQHFAQLTTQSRYFSNKQNFNFEPPP